MGEEPMATRRDVDLLAGRMDQLSSRVDTMDQHGTRGVGLVQQRLDDVVKDLAKLEVVVDTRFLAVDARFSRQEEDRKSGRRWAVGMVIAGGSSVATVIALLVEILHQLH